MSGPGDDQAPAKLARANRLRLAAEEGVRAMEEVTKESIAVRKNMARLRGLRLAKEADAVRSEIAEGNAPKAKTKKRSKSK